MVEAFAVYLLEIFLLLMVGRALVRVARQYNAPAELTVITGLSVWCYLSCLLPGAVGLFYPRAIVIVFVALAGVSLLVLRRLHSVHLANDRTIEPTMRPWSASDFILTGIGLCGCSSFLAYLSLFPNSILGRHDPLPWDTVSYHLPNFIEFLQAHTLWLIKSPAQSYSFGFEFIGNIFSHPFHSQFGIIAANLLANVFLVAGVYRLASRTSGALHLAQPVNVVPVCVLAVGGWSAIFRIDLMSPGLNDVFLTACLLSALALLLELWATPAEHQVARQPFLLSLVGMDLGLALATKPTALAFFPFFGLAAWLLLDVDNRPFRLRATIPALLVAALTLSGAFAIGGFFLVRNVAMIGHLAAPSEGWRWTLLANLRNPALYHLKREAGLFVLCLVAFAAFLALILSSRARHHDWRNWLLLGFQATAIIAFTVTPFGLSDPNIHWQLRLGMPVLVASGIVGALLLAVLPRWRLPSGGRAWETALAPGLIVAALVIAWQSKRLPEHGLPGYEVVHDLPPTGAYAWVQSMERPVRIYAAGLRPYGLFGRQWQNTLFYDLHSSPLALPSGPARIASVVRVFDPELILISIDPHDGVAATQPAVVRWMESQPAIFSKVYADATVVGFKVIDQAALGRKFAPGEDPQMIM